MTDVVQLQRGEFAEALSRLLGLKGQVPIPFDPTLLLQLQLLNVATTPFSRIAAPCGGAAAQANLAGENSHVFVRPGPNVVLQVLRWRFFNNTAATIFGQMVMGSASTAALIANNRASAKLQELVGSPGGAVGDLRSSTIETGTRTGAHSGTVIDQFEVPIDSSITIDAPAGTPGWCLFGNEPQGLPFCGINCTVANVELRGSVYCLEWPLPG